MANQCGRAPRWQRRLGYLSAGVECTSRERPNFGTRRRPGRGSSDLYPVAFLHSNGTETKRNKEVGQRCYFETVGSVVGSLESTPSCEKTGIGKDIARGAHCGSIGIPFPPAKLHAQGGEKRRSPTNSEQSALFRSRHGHLRDHKPEREQNLHDAQSWQSRHG